MKNEFYAIRTSSLSEKLAKQLTEIDKLSDIKFGDKFVETKPKKIDGVLVRAFQYTNKKTGREMIGFAKVVEHTAEQVE